MDTASKAIGQNALVDAEAGLLGLKNLRRALPPANMMLQIDCLHTLQLIFCSVNFYTMPCLQK